MNLKNFQALLPMAAARSISDDFKLFVEGIIGFTNAPFQDEMDDVISNAIYKYVCMAFPRGHGKSSHLSIAYPLWEIAKNHNVRILIVSSTQQIAKSFITEIVGHIEGNEAYKTWAQIIDSQRLGVIPKKRKYKQQEENWAGSSIVINREELRLKDPTINAVGLFGSILSKRADVVIVDDLVNQQNSETEDQRQKIKDWVYTTLMPVLVPGGRFIYLGNTWHHSDLVADFLKDPKFDYRKKLSAIQKESERPDLWDKWAAIILEEGKPIEERKRSANLFYEENVAQMELGVKVLWPERYSYRDLFMIRLSNSYAFERMFQCDPSNRPDQRFQEAWLEQAKYKGRVLKLQEEPRDGLIMDMTASGLDLAISEEELADDTALLTLDRVRIGNGEIRPGDYIVRNIWRGKFTPNQVREEVKRHWAVVRPVGIRVETVGYQEAMKRDLEESGVPVTGYHTGGEKRDSAIGVNSLAILAEQGKLVIPYDVADPRTVRLCSQLVNEMRAYPEGHTGDSLMAMWFALSEIRDQTGQIVIPRTLAVATKGATIDINDPAQRKVEEKKIDMAQAMEQEAERRMFWGR